MFVWITVAFVPVLYAGVVLCAWRAIQTARTPQGSVGWVVFLFAAPYFAIPLFLVLGRRRYPGYVIARTQSERVVDGLNRFAKQHAPHPPVTAPARAMEKLARVPLVRGNDIELLIDGEATFAAIFDAIDAAQAYVLVQFYIVRDDAMGRALSDRLIAAAKRGVRVCFLIDRVGSGRLSRRYVRHLGDAGVAVVNADQARGPTSRLEINFRNHRKTVIVDGAVAFTGGLNVGEEYMGRDPTYGRWRDTHARLTGPIVAQLQLVYLEDWHWATNALLDDLVWDTPRTKADMNALIMATGPGDDTETGALFFFTAISAAVDRVWVASPYFVPDTDVLSALKHAALKGVDVRILVPDSIDHRIPWLAAYGYFDEVMNAGVQIWRYRDGFMHQKVVLVDETMLAVGTTNLDNRSFRLNFEAMAVYFDGRAAQAGREMLESDFDRATRLQRTLFEQPAHIRYGAPVARLFAPLL